MYLSRLNRLSWPQSRQFIGSINFFGTSTFCSKETNNSPIMVERKLAKRNYVPASKTNLNFVKNLFLGKLIPETIIFPEIKSTEELTELNSFLEPVVDYFNKVNPSDITSCPRLPSDYLRHLKQLGVFGAEIPEDYGGIGMTPLEAGRLMEIVGQDMSTIVSLSNHNKIVLQFLLECDSENLKQKYLPKLASGELIATYCTTDVIGNPDMPINGSEAFLQDNDMYILNGKKSWVVNATNSDLFLMSAFVEEINDMGVKENQKRFFLVEKDFGGVNVTGPINTACVEAADVCEVTFDTTEIPAENKLKGNFNDNVIDFNTRHAHLTALGTSSILKQVLAEVVDHVISNDKMDLQLQDDNLTQEKLAEVETQIYGIESISYLTAGLYEQHHAEDLTIESSIVKVYSSTTAINCLQTLMEVIGSETYLKENKLNKLLADFRFNLIYPTSNDTLNMLIALNCLQHTGIERLDEVKKSQDPFQNPDVLIKKVLSSFTNKYEKPTFTIELYDHVHPNLAFDGEAIEIRIHRLSMMAVQYCSMFGNGLTGEQYILNHFAAIVTHLYVALAVMSRASRAISIGLRNCDMEIALAHLHVLNTINQVDYHLNTLKAVKVENGDVLKKKVCKSMLKSRGYSVSHPLTRNW